MSSSKTWTLQPGEEFRFEVSFKETLEIQLTSGHAEYFGTELGRDLTYTFTGTNGAVFSWQGCQLTVSGTCQSTYVAGETPMDAYINVHMALQQLRVTAKSSHSQGPRVMLIGPQDSGKTSLAKILINYSVRQGERPLFANLDVGAASVTVPGTLSAAPMSKVIDARSGFMCYATPSSEGPPDMPLVWQFGHEQPSDNTVLFNLLVDRMGQAIDNRLSNQPSSFSGVIVDTTGFTDVSKCQHIEHALEALKITTLLVVGNERMHSHFTNKLAGVEVVKLNKSGGTVDRQATFRQQENARAIRQYFYGIPCEQPVTSFSTVVNFQEIKILRVGEEAVAPSSTLPLGEIPKSTDTLVFPVDPADESLSHSILAVTDATGEDEVVGMSVAGFVNVTKVDLEKKRFLMISPVPGRLPKQTLLLGNIKWMETL